MLSKCIECGETIDIEISKDRLCSEECRDIKKGKNARLEEEKNGVPGRCCVCGAPAMKIRLVENIHIPTCNSEGCQAVSEKEYFRILMQKRRRKFVEGHKCEVPECEFAITIDKHHDLNRQVYYLCPNHHALITRGFRTLGELGVKPKSA